MTVTTTAPSSPSWPAWTPSVRAGLHISHPLFLLGDDSQLPLRGFSPQPSSINPPEREKNPLISFVTDLNTEKYEEEHLPLKITVRFEASDGAEGADGVWSFNVLHCLRKTEESSKEPWITCECDVSVPQERPFCLHV